MDIVAQILSEEPGRTEQEEYQISDLPSALQPTSSGDRKHVTLYPGNYADEFTTQSGNGIEIEIPINVSVTILPGAIVEYTENYRNQKFESGNVTYEGDVIEATDGSGDPKHPLSPDQSSTVGVGDVESDEAYFRYKAPEFTGHVENISDLNLASDWAFKQDFERSLWFVRSTDQPNEEPFPVPFENVVEFGAGENIDITVSELSGSPDKGPNVLIDHSDIVTSGQYVEELNPQDPETRFFVENEDTSRVIQNLEIDDGHVTNVDSLEIVESVEAVDDGLEVSSPEGTNNRGNIKIQHNTDGREVDKTALNVSDTGFPAGDGFVVEEVFTDGQGHVTDVDYQPNVTDLTDGFLVKAEHLGPSDPGTYEIAHQTIDIEGSPQNSGTTVIQSVRPFVEQGGSGDETGHIDRVETIDIVGSQGISTATDANNNIEIGLDAQVSENISLAARSIGQSSSDLTLDASEHRVFEFEPTADIDVDITGLPTSRRTRTYLAIKNGGQQNVTFKADGQEGKWNWVDGTRPNLGTPTTTGNTFDLNGYSTTGNAGAVGTTYARNALSIRWGPNGNTLFTPLVDEFGDATPFGEFIELYDASNPYDITNLSSSGNRLDISSQVGEFGDGPTPITDLAFNDDGSKVYVSDSAQGQVVSFSLNSAYGSNGSVANTVDTTSSPPGGSSHTVTPRGVEFGDSGSVLIVSGVDGGTEVINSYALGTPYDISTIQSSKQADVSANESDPTTPRFNANGTKLFVGGEGSGGTPTVTSFTLSAPYDISTLSFENSLATGTGEVTGIDFTPNGSELHVLDITGSPNFDNESITEFGASTSTAPSIDIVSVHQRGGEVYADSGSRTLTVDHPDTGADDFSGANGEVVNDIETDGKGHVDTIGSIDLDTRYYTETEADNRFVNESGDSMSGDLTFTEGVDDSFNNQVARNIIFDSDSPDNSEGNNGDVWMDFGDPTPEVVTSISGGTNISVTQNTGAVTVSHGLTGGANSTSNSNGSVVQDISFDTRGHATSVQSTNLDNRYNTYTDSDAISAIENEDHLSLSWNQNTDGARLEMIDYGNDSDYLTLTVNDNNDNLFRIRTDDGTTTNTADFAADGITFYRTFGFDSSGTTVNSITTSLGDPGDDDTLATEAAIRNAISLATPNVQAGTDITITTGTNSKTINHADTGAASSTGNSGGVVLQTIDSDGRGHLTSVGTVDLDSRFVNETGDSMSGDLTFTEGVDDSFNNQVARNIIFDSDAPTNTEGDDGDVWMNFEDPTPEVVTSISGGTPEVVTSISGGTSITVTQNTGAVTVSHGMTGGATSTSNPNGSVVQDIFFDTRGHATDVQSTNLDNRYYTQSSADSNFVKESGDAMSGNLTVPSMDSNGTIDVNNGSGASYSIQTDSDIRSEQDVIANYSSDRRLKTNIKNIDGALDKVDKITGVKYDWTEDFRRDGTNYGFIAQEVREVLPESIKERNDGTLGLDYKQTIPLLANAIKELKRREEKKSEKIEKLQDRIQELK